MGQEILAKDICIGCKAKCCYFGGPIVTKEERDAIISKYPDYFSENGTLFQAVTEDKCPYLKDDTCSIYDVRPKVCRVWPVIVGEEDGERFYLLAHCPLKLDKDAISKLIEEAKTMPIEVVQNNWNLPPHVMQRIRSFPIEEL